MPLLGFAKRHAAFLRARRPIVVTVQAALEGSTFTVTCRRSDPIGSLIPECMPHRPRRDAPALWTATPKLIFAGQPLNEGRTFRDYNIKSGATLQLVWQASSFLLFVRVPAGHRVVVEANPETSIANLMFQVYEKEGIPPKHQHMSFAGESLNPHRRLADYEIDPHR